MLLYYYWILVYRQFVQVLAVHSRLYGPRHSPNSHYCDKLRQFISQAVLQLYDQCQAPDNVTVVKFFYYDAVKAN